jgi:hypothetical protein
MPALRLPARRYAQWFATVQTQTVVQEINFDK